METQKESAEVAVSSIKPSDGVPNGGAAAAASKRLEKRWKWWSQEKEKRFGGDLPSSDSVTPNGIPVNGKKAEGKVKNPKYPPREPVVVPRRGSGKGKDDQAKKKEQSNYTIFVGQIPFDAKEEEVKKLFESAGTIKPDGFRWRTNPETKKFKGFAFVDYANKPSFERSFTLHHSLINGRPINVEATIAGGRKSNIRKEHVKDRTAKLLKKAADAVAAKKAKEAAATDPTDASAESSLKRPAETSETPETTADSAAKKLKPESTARPNKRIRQRLAKSKVHPYELAGTPDSSKVDAKDSVLKDEPVPVKIEESNSNWLSRKQGGGLKAVPEIKPAIPAVSTSKPAFVPPKRPVVVSGVKPKESHLAALVSPRLHIKFPE